MTATEEEKTATGRRASPETAERRQKAADLKASMEEWIEKVGGWNGHGVKADICRIAEYLDHDARYLQPSLSGWMSQGTLGDGARESFAKVDALIRSRMKGGESAERAWVTVRRLAAGQAEPDVDDSWPFTVELLPLTELFVDLDYQRPVHEDFVRETLLKFDKRLVGAIDVSKRAGVKKRPYAILDGQQRSETMRRLGMTQCWCAIYTGMSIAEEAAFFYHKNRDRKQMAYWYAFRARLLSGDATATMISDIVTQAGFTLGVATDQKDQIGAVKAIEEVYHAPTAVWPNALAPTLREIRTCFYGRTDSLNGSLIRGLGKFLSLYGKDEINWQHFEEVLTSLGPQLVIGRARDAAATRGKGVSSKTTIVFAEVLCHIHNTGLPRGERLDPTRIPKSVEKKGSGPRLDEAGGDE